MTTDTAKLAEQFRKFCKKWDLESGETDMQAHNKALVALHAWLRTGVDSPEVVIRAVQVLMADPERPAIHKRPAIDLVFSQISAEWGAAGLKKQDVLILQAMLLAAWPQNLRDGYLFLNLLLESAWGAIQSKGVSNSDVLEWRVRQAGMPSPFRKSSLQVPAELTKIIDVIRNFEIPEYGKKIEAVGGAGGHYAEDLANKVHNALTSQQKSMTAMVERLNIIQNYVNYLCGVFPKLSGCSVEMANSLNQLVENATQSEQQDLLWWGQARYSDTLRCPYRRIVNTTERLWWMAWESSTLAMELDVEPSACFLIETVYQLTSPTEDQKRPLQEWLGELMEVLRKIHDEGRHAESISVGTQLEAVAKKDALGLPVTWVRLKATEARTSATSIGERLREDCAIDPETKVDLGEWAAWIFREVLLDRHFGDE